MENTRFPVVCLPMETKWPEHRIETCLLASLPLPRGNKTIIMCKTESDLAENQT